MKYVDFTCDGKLTAVCRITHVRKCSGGLGEYTKCMFLVYPASICTPDTQSQGLVFNTWFLSIAKFALVFSSMLNLPVTVCAADAASSERDGQVI